MTQQCNELIQPCARVQRHSADRFKLLTATPYDIEGALHSLRPHHKTQSNYTLKLSCICQRVVHELHSWQALQVILCLLVKVDDVTLHLPAPLQGKQ